MGINTRPHSNPVFVQSLSLPLRAFLSPLSWPLPLSPHLLTSFGPVGVAGLSGQTDPPGVARLVASGCSCVQRGLELERNWREVVRVLGQTEEGWFLSPPSPRPGLFPGWQQPGLLLLNTSHLALALPGAPASTGSRAEPLLWAEMRAGWQGPLLDSLRAQLT